MKTVKINGRYRTLPEPGELRRIRSAVAEREAVLVPCRGRLLLNCTKGPGCRGHKVKWILLP